MEDDTSSLPHFCPTQILEMGMGRLAIGPMNPYGINFRGNGGLGLRREEDRGREEYDEHCRWLSEETNRLQAETKRRQQRA
jgi:hypothetical protein